MRYRKLFSAVSLCVILVMVSCACNTVPSTRDHPENAYYLVFQALGDDVDLSHSGRQYLAVDLSKAKIPNTKPLVNLLRAYCDKYHFTLLLDSYKDLCAKGYIGDEPMNEFADGVLVTFTDQKLTRNILTTSVSFYFASLSSRGADYTVTKKNGQWAITGTSHEWIS